MFIFSKNQLLVSVFFSIVFSFSISFISALIFLNSFLLITLGFVCSSSSSRFKEERINFYFFILYLLYSEFLEFLP